MRVTRFTPNFNHALGLIIVVLAALSPAAAQNRYAVTRCQDEIRFRIQRDRDSRLRINFRSPQEYSVSSAQVGIRGRGDADGRNFNYDCTINVRYEGLENASYNFTQGGGNGGGSNVPNWLVGSFRGRNPANRQAATVTVYPTGEVSAAYDNGGSERGRFDGNTIQFERAATWAVERTNDGFRATDNRRSEDFRRSSDGGGDTGRVPGWAVGTFRGTTDSGESELNINADGTVTARSITTNQSFPGVYSNGTLRFDWGVFNLSREGNDIRTTEVNNPNNRTTYRRVRN